MQINQGKFVITAMVAVGLGMAVFAWWARYSASQRVLERFGPQVAVAVRNGERVELLDLDTDAGDLGTGELESISIQVAGRKREIYVANRRDITKAPGLIHARHHLLHEKGFEWEDDKTVEVTPDRNWTVALRFTHGSKVATWLLDFDHRRTYIVERETEIGMGPIAASLRTFLDGL